MTEIDPVRVGVIGCGNISAIYLKNCVAAPELDIVACADIDPAAARARAEEFGVPRTATVDELLEDPEVEVVLDLTIPAAHSEINLRAIEAGKHLYSEKPLALSREHGQQILAAAAAKGLLVGCAPDTFFGAPWQACRRLIDEGVIGDPVGVTAFMMSRGMEHWHPNPDFFYQPGAGPLFDMGPYYLTMMIVLLGPVQRVAGSARITFPERTITSQARRGEMIPVTTPTHVAGLLDFLGGAVGTMITTFDVWSHSLPRIEIYGSEGTILAPDPNNFHGTVQVRYGREREWNAVTFDDSYTYNARGLGLADMAVAIRTGGVPRASGEMGYHVLDTMQSILDSSNGGRHIMLESTCRRPEALPVEINLPAPAAAS